MSLISLLPLGEGLGKRVRSMRADGNLEQLEYLLPSTFGGGVGVGVRSLGVRSLTQPRTSSSARALALKTLRRTSSMPRESTEIARFMLSS